MKFVNNMATKKKYKVDIYYSTYCSYEVEAKSEEEVWQKVKGLDINSNEILSNLERWEEADTIEEI